VDIQADTHRDTQTDTHTDTDRRVAHNTLHPYRGGVKTTNQNHQNPRTQ